MHHRPQTILSLAGALLFMACRDDGTLTETTPPGEVTMAQPAPVTAEAVNTWSSRASPPTGRYLHSAGVANNAQGQSIFYMFGGYDITDLDGTQNFRSVATYNLATDSWGSGADAPFRFARTNGATLVGGRFYVPGGGGETGNGFEIEPTLRVYNPTTNTWTQRADMPEPSSEGVSGEINGKLYVLTGLNNAVEGCPDCGPPVRTRKLFRYDPASNTWVTRRQCPNFHAGAAAGVINGKFYVAGGFPSDNKLDIYDPATNTWSAGAPLPRPQTRVAGVVLGGRLYVIGGDGNLVQVYNPATNRWSTRASMPTARVWLAAGRVFLDGRPRILAVGGLLGSDEEVGFANEMYTP